MWAINSQLFFVAAYGDTGKSTTSVSLKTWMYTRVGGCNKRGRWAEMGGNGVGKFES